MRVFIAICLDEKIKKGLLAIQKNLKIDALSPKWQKDCHITLKFLGEITKERLDRVLDVCHKDALACKSFVVSFGFLGAFPKPEYPRVIWLGIEKGRGYIEFLASSLDEHLSKIGFAKEERGYFPHITLARIRNIQRTSLLFPYLKEKFILDEMSVDKIKVIESKLTPTGPIYTIIKDFPLRQPDLNL
ncbi:TPA: RNA 2',3'-cyclic phosphodiesterase [bacterium]|nr:RNA 2',3'-cyclic phosphodiesterase [bacterium]